MSPRAVRCCAVSVAMLTLAQAGVARGQSSTGAKATAALRPPISAASFASPGVLNPTALMSTSGVLTFQGDFESGVKPWTNGGGSVQCLNYGTPSKSPRQRGTFQLVSSPVGQGSWAGEFSLPAGSSASSYPFEACNMDPAPTPLSLGSDQYLGLMVYMPVGWTIPNRAFWGVNIEELHFQNVNGAPITLQLHPNHITIALQTGGCSVASTSQPGCQYRSNADNPGCPAAPPSATCLPGYYAVPPGALAQGGWTEIILYVHWASDSTGAFQAWYRTPGQTGWTQSSGMSGYPTMQWDSTLGCCRSGYVDLLEAYTAALSAPLNVWMDNQVAGTGFGAVAATMPGPAAPPPGGGGSGGTGAPGGSGGSGGAGGPGGSGGSDGHSPGSAPSATTSTPPVVTGLSQSASTWVEGGTNAQLTPAFEHPTGTTFSVGVNESAELTFTFVRPGASAARERLCTDRGHRARAGCRRVVVVGLMRFAGRAGTNHVAFDGRISSTTKLRPGRYVLIVTATNAAGQRSAARALSFRILAPRAGSPSLRASARCARCRGALQGLV